MELTPTGEALLESALPVWREVQDRFESRVGKER